MVKIKVDNIKSYEDKLSFVIRGSQREKIIKALNSKRTPTQIKKLTKISLNNISDNLRLMDEIGIVKCLNEKNITGRFYQLTDIGEKIRKEITR